ncbi:MAG: amino acid adenylation domain-containing protein, partial [bacterium]|nr:amino acid adenylation domain-containing protein [bacterium]
MSGQNTYEEAKIAAGQFIQEKKFWTEAFAGEIKKCVIPYDFKNVIESERKIQRVSTQFNEKITSRLLAVSRGSDAQLHMILMAGITMLIEKYTGEKDIITGSPIDKQEQEGEFVNTVIPIRARLEDSMTFKEMLLQLRKTINDSVANQNYPVEVLVYDDLKMPEENEFVLFDTAVVLENIQDIKYMEHINLNLIFSFFNNGDAVEVKVDYNSARYHKETIERQLKHLSYLLEQALFDVNLPLNGIEVLSEPEKKQLLEDFNNIERAFTPGQSIYSYIEKEAETNPEKIAVSCEGAELTYEELNVNANRLAKELIEAGIGVDKLVGILMNRSIPMVESIVAVWKAGGAYIPIATTDPRQRIAGILNDSEAPVLLTRTPHAGPALETAFKGKIIKLDKSNYNDVQQQDPGNPGLDIPMESLAYVIYTSGSTGQPKGAMVEHLGMMNHIMAKIEELQITPESIVAQNASHTFDISVWQMFVALVKGGKIIIYPGDFVLETQRFIARVAEDNVTILEVVPSYLSVMFEFLKDSGGELDKLEYLLVTGEAVKPNLVKQWFALYPGIKMVNAYGPTEASDDITHHMMDNDNAGERVPIGKPLQGFNIYIVDDQTKLCPIGVTGEIYVAGIGVGRGYLNDRAKTEAAFINDPFAEGETRRLYKTGDLGRWLPDGTIDFFGRKDHQVKIRGFRIECGEIESALEKHPQVKESVVIDREDKNGVKYLCAYLVAEDQLDDIQIKEYLAEGLPDYMVPAHITQLEKLPLTPNGKVDRKALPEPQIGKAATLKYIK